MPAEGSFETTSLTYYLSAIQSGWSPACEEIQPGVNEWGVVRVSAVTQGVFREGEAKRIPSSLEPRPWLEITSGDLLMARANGAKNLVGVTCLVGRVRGKLMLSDKTLRLRPDPAKGTAKFLHYVLSSRQVRNQIESLLGGSTGQANISQETVAALQVPKVSLSDQARIVDMLDAVTEAEREAQEAITKLRSVRSGIVLSGMASIEATDVPIGWERVTLKEVVPSVDYGISVALNEDARGIPALRMNNLHDGRPDLRDLRYCPQAVHSKHLLRAGDVLFNRTNSIEHVGRAGIWDGELERATFASYLVRLNPDIRRLSPRYLVEWLQHPVIRQRVRSVATVAVQQVNVNPSRLRELVIDLPVDLDEQGKLVASLEMCDHLISVEEENLRKVRVMKQGIIAELLNGKLSHQNV